MYVKPPDQEKKFSIDEVAGHLCFLCHCHVPLVYKPRSHPDGVFVHELRDGFQADTVVCTAGVWHRATRKISV